MPARIFTPRFKQRGRVTAAIVTLWAGAVPFIGGLLALQVLPQERGWLPALVTAVSFALGGLLPWASQNLMGLAGNQRLRRQLRELLLAESPGLDLSRSLFVGFSPGEQLHVWHGETSRDVGFLQILPNGLVYHGDEFSWTLPRDHIDHIDLSPPEGGMQRLLIRWHVPREGGRTLSLEAREALTIARARQATAMLYRHLRDWHRAGEQPEPLSVGSGVPPTDMSGAQSIEAPARGSCLTILAVMTITLVTLWRIAGAMLRLGMLYQSILWAGMISVLGALFAGYLLHYLQTWEAERARTTPPK